MNLYCYLDGLIEIEFDFLSSDNSQANRAKENEKENVATAIAVKPGTSIVSMPVMVTESEKTIDLRSQSNDFGIENPSNEKELKFHEY